MHYKTAQQKERKETMDDGWRGKARRWEKRNTNIAAAAHNTKHHRIKKAPKPLINCTTDGR